MGLAAFLSSFLATSFAKLLDFNKDLTAAGIYSYNACLCGCALIVFSGNIIGAWFGIIITSMLSVLVTQCVANVSVPIGITPLTFPFQVSTWLFLLTIQVSSHTTTRYGLVPALNNHISNTTIVTNAAIYTPQIYDGNMFIYNILTGIAQTFLVNNWISGVVMTIGIFLCSPISCNGIPRVTIDFDIRSLTESTWLSRIGMYLRIRYLTTADGCYVLGIVA